MGERMVEDKEEGGRRKMAVRVMPLCPRQRIWVVFLGLWSVIVRSLLWVEEWLKLLLFHFWQGSWL